MSTSRESDWQPVELDAGRPHSARIWNYWLGGKDNFRADREAGDEFLELYPAQQEALLELVTGSHVILSTPTGSGPT